MRASVAYIGCLPWLLLSSQTVFAINGPTYSLCIAAYRSAPSKIPTKQDIYFCERAARDGHSDAIYILGLFYDNGLGVEKNRQIAIKHYKEAAVKGHKEAQSVVNDIEGTNQHTVDRKTTPTSSPPAQSNTQGAKNSGKDEGFSLGQIIFFCAIGYLLLGALFRDRNKGSSGRGAQTGSSRKCITCNGSGKEAVSKRCSCHGGRNHFGGMCVQCSGSMFKKEIRTCSPCGGTGFY